MSGIFYDNLIRSIAIKKMELDRLQKRLDYMTRRCERAETARNRLARCLSEIEMFIAKYRIPEEE